jgi:hypothetical protein
MIKRELEDDAKHLFDDRRSLGDERNMKAIRPRSSASTHRRHGMLDIGDRDVAIQLTRRQMVITIGHNVNEVVQVITISRDRRRRRRPRTVPVRKRTGGKHRCIVGAKVVERFDSRARQLIVDMLSDASELASIGSYGFLKLPEGLAWRGTFYTGATRIPASLCNSVTGLPKGFHGSSIAGPGLVKAMALPKQDSVYGWSAGKEVSAFYLAPGIRQGAFFALGHLEELVNMTLLIGDQHFPRLGLGNGSQGTAVQRPRQGCGHGIDRGLSAANTVVEGVNHAVQLVFQRLQDVLGDVVIGRPVSLVHIPAWRQRTARRSLRLLFSIGRVEKDSERRVSLDGSRGLFSGYGRRNRRNDFIENFVA